MPISNQHKLILVHVPKGEKIEIPIVNKSNNNRYQDYYINNDLIEIVKNHYLLDIESFNFKFSKNI